MSIEPIERDGKRILALEQENATLKKRVEYYEREICYMPPLDNEMWGALESGVTVREINPEKVGKIFQERETLKKRVEELEQWVSDLQSGLYINCVYCGHRYAPGTPGTMSKVLYEHIKQCPKHPLTKAEADLAQLKEAVKKIEDIIKTGGAYKIAQIENVLDSLSK